MLCQVAKYAWYDFGHSPNGKFRLNTCIESLESQNGLLTIEMVFFVYIAQTFEKTLSIGFRNVNS